MENVKVAVRVRPFNDREKERKAKCIISMKGNSTTIRNPETGELKTFAFDFSYWSHCHSDANYADQRTVFNDLGSSVLKNAWNGYNVSLFAYGQTGACDTPEAAQRPRTDAIFCQVLARATAWWATVRSAASSHARARTCSAASRKTQIQTSATRSR